MIINLPDYNMYIDNSKENDNYFNNNYLQIFKIFSGQKLKFYLYFFLSTFNFLLSYKYFDFI